jgi:photosystem II stability/assembly factor-like uncharacterized protein
MKTFYKYLVLVTLWISPYYNYSQLYWDSIVVPDTIQIICIATNNLNHIFLGTGGNNIFGGIYRSVDQCNSWEFLGFKNWGNRSIDLDEYNHIYTGSHGDIYKSTDNGNSWTKVFESLEIACIKSYTGGIIFSSSTTGTYNSSIRSLDYGLSWEEVYIFPSTSEYVLDFAILNEDTVYAGSTHWFDGGGVYQSIDGGDNWEHFGMYNFHVTALALNSNGDLFAGTYGHNTQYWLSGVYVLYHGEDEWTELYNELVNDIIINSSNDIFVATDNGVLLSTDNGQSFEYINEGLFTGDVDDLALDSAGYLYASAYNPVHLAKSADPTITDFHDNNVWSNEISVQNYPNPFSYSITIEYHLKKESTITIQIFNANGQKVDESICKDQTKGNHKIQWNAEGLPAGIYLYSIKIGNQTTTGKVVLL